ncbi:hypothetical protein JYU04_00050 [Dehalococcoides mccartyi]|nr:hypothetical protein [Dehalococcoides mccartyi]
MTKSTSATCPVCQGALEVTLATGRKSRKRSLSMVCLADARHYRGFIHDKTFVESAFSHHGDPQGSQGK